MAESGITVTARIFGADALEFVLRTLEPKVSRKIVTKSLRVGAKIIQAATKSIVPVKRGKLKRSLKVRVMPRNRKGTKALSVTTGIAGNIFVGDEFYGGFLELGTVRIRPKPYLKPAFEATKGAALNAALASLAKGIEDTARKGGKVTA